MFGKAMVAAAVVGCLAANAAYADGRGHGKGRKVGHTEYARVVHVEPMVRYVTVDRPRQECWQEIVHEPVRPFNGVAGPTAAGAIVGAAVGRQFGGGSGRDALTLIGSIAGAAVANQRAVRNQAYRGTDTRAVAVDRCNVVNERFTEERIDGYRVTYEYHGRRFVTHTPHHPGNRVPVAVNVVPIRY